MKIVLIWSVYIALQVVWTSADTNETTTTQERMTTQEPSTTMEPTTTTAGSSAERKDILDRAKEHVKKIEEAEKEAANNTTQSRQSKRLSQFLESTAGITNAGQIARVMLDVMKEELLQWLQEEADAGREGTYEEFWNQVWSSGEEVLKTNNSQSGSSESDVCPYLEPHCSDLTLQYRTFDGTCNNQRPGYTQWGSKDRAQNRMIHPDYADGIGEARKAKSGNNLPNARKVARFGMPAHSSPSGVNTVLLMTMGQFLDHDITLTPGSTFFDYNGKIKPVVCGNDGCGKGLSENAAVDCFPIEIDDETDPMYPDVRCMGFVRSGPIIEDKCRPSPRQHANAITAWIDASQTYGSSKDVSDQLRDLRNPARGRMIVSRNPMNDELKPLLPYLENSKSSCSGVDDTIHCFRAGDVRQNEQIGLMSMHTLFVRLHNLIEGKLHTVNPHWGGKKLYHESRRIVGALWQHLVYNEYLPAILGKNNMEKYGLETGHNADYKDDMQPDIFNVFSTAAFRFGHTQIPNSLKFADSAMEIMNSSHLSNLLFNPQTLYESPQMANGMSGIDSCVLGMAAGAAEGYDGHFSEQVSNHLFAENPPHGWGLDLRALNVQRGRDHGIPGYTKWREECDLHVPTGFDDIEDMQDGCVDRFRNLYEDVADIDLFPAGVCEKPKDGAIVGPTFACIISRQFKALKDGDRFFYENEENGFDIWHKQEIRKYSISRLLCDTLDHVSEIQPYILWQSYSKLSQSDQNDYAEFYEKMNWNERVSCNDIERPNHDVFAEDYEPPNSDSGSNSSSSPSTTSSSS